MKTIWFLTIIASVVASGCNTGTKRPQSTTDAVVLIDVTDALPLGPQMLPITSVLDADKYRGFRLTVAPVTEMDINGEFTESLPEESSYSIGKKTRDAQVQNFRKQGQAFMDSLVSSIRSGEEHTVLYRTVARHLNGLAHSTAPNRVAYIFSDLMEHDFVSFYNPKTWSVLTTHTDSIQHILEAEYPLADLHGVTVYLIFSPKDFTANRQYMRAARFFERLLSSHGATVRIGNSIHD